jgi:DNA-binding SARP family transcriptional activator
MPLLSISLLGGLEVTLNGEPVTAFGTNKARGLLAFLAVNSASLCPRTELAAMWWPDLPEKKAAHNLSQTLLRLRLRFGKNRPPFSLSC